MAHPVPQDPTGTAGTNGATGVIGASGSFGITGTTGQTLHHNGTAWVANSTLYNNGINVGVGVDVPATRLHVRGASTAGGTLSSAFIVQNSTGFQSSLSVRLKDNETNLAADYNSISNPNNSNFTLSTRTSSQASTEKMRITNSGNVGIGTSTPAARLHIIDSSVVFSAAGSQPLATPGAPPISGAGRRMMWYADKAAFRAGAVDGTQWDNTNLGIYSTAMGRSATASAAFSTAMGFNNTSSGENSTAMGRSTTAPPLRETTLGSFNTTYTLGTNGATQWNDTDRLFTVGNGKQAVGSSSSDALTILKNGEVKIGNIGTYHTNVQEGQANGGSSAGVFKTAYIAFPTEFTSPAANVRIIVTAENELTTFTDEYLVTIKYVTTLGAAVIIRRMDGPTSWGQNLKLNWMAWE